MTLAHEATHAVEDILGLKSNLPDAPFRLNRWSSARNHFQEGIATMLGIFYVMESEDQELMPGIEAQLSLIAICLIKIF